MEFINLKDQYKILKEQIDIQISEVLENAQFILGDKVLEFEKKLAEYVGVKHVISCSDGTSALQLIFMAEEIGYGDAVFCPDMTFIASIEPACLLGATPVFCDIDELSYNISPDSLERQIKKVIDEGKLKPKAVVAVDFVGNPASYKHLKEITQEYGLLLIEDAAQGMGAVYKGKKCGSLGDIGATSFFPSKPLGCYGDGGAVFTNNDEKAELIKSLRVHGKGITKYDNIHIGINSRLDAIQAAILIPKLNILEKEIQRRQEIAKLYDKELQNYIKIPNIDAGSMSSYAQYIVCASSKKQRNNIVNELRKNEIPSIIYYPNPLHRLPIFKNINLYTENFQNADKYSECSLGLPFSPYLNKEDQERVIMVVKQAIQEG